MAKPVEQPFQRAPPQYGGESLPRDANAGVATVVLVTLMVEARIASSAKLRLRNESESPLPSALGATAVTPGCRASRLLSASSSRSLYRAGSTEMGTVRRSSPRIVWADEGTVPFQYTCTSRFSGAVITPAYPEARAATIRSAAESNRRCTAMSWAHDAYPPGTDSAPGNASAPDD